MIKGVFRATILAAIIGITMPSFAAEFQQKNLDLGSLRSMDAKNSDALRKQIGNENDTPKEMRLRAMKDAALAIGAQHGYVDQLNKLKAQINANSKNLDDIYDFSVLMRLASDKDSELYLLPPVVQESHDIVSTSDDATRMRISGKMYVILKPEKLVTAAPNWRQYLLFDQDVEIVSPPDVLLPRDNSEKEKWSKWIDKGWEAGIRQAEREMTYRVRQLGDDFTGMTRYMILLTNGKISKPVVVSSHQNVIGKGSQMREDEKIIQLSSPASLNPNAKKWEAIEMDNRKSLRYPSEK
jgi:hypothetical protein